MNIVEPCLGTHFNKTGKHVTADEKCGGGIFLRIQAWTVIQYVFLDGAKAGGTSL